MPVELGIDQKLRLTGIVTLLTNSMYTFMLGGIVLIELILGT